MIGIVNGNAVLEESVASFKKGMRDYGYYENSNISYIYDGVSRDKATIANSVNYMMSRKVDLIYCLSGFAARTVKKIVKNKDIPILCGPVVSPVVSGLIKPWHSSGDNITAIKIRGSMEKLLEYLLLVLPDARTLYVPYFAFERSGKTNIADLKAACDKRGITIISEALYDFPNMQEYEFPESTDAVVIIYSFMIGGDIEKFVEAATRRKIPVIGGVGKIRSGLLLTYASDLKKIGLQASRMANNILKGVLKPGLPIETADFFLSVNMKAAEMLNIKIPNSILLQSSVIVR